MLLSMQRDIADFPNATVTPTSLRMRIAETRIRQHRVAALLDISQGHLSHILAGRRAADAAFLGRIAAAIEQVAAES
jgi:hypothetical protein